MKKQIHLALVAGFAAMVGVSSCTSRDTTANPDNSPPQETDTVPPSPQPGQVPQPEYQQGTRGSDPLDEAAPQEGFGSRSNQPGETPGTEGTEFGTGTRPFRLGNGE